MQRVVYNSTESLDVSVRVSQCTLEERQFGLAYELGRVKVQI